MRLMIGFRTFAAALVVAGTLGLTACGGGDDDDATQNASKQLQEQGVKAKDADELAQTAQKLKESGFSEDDAAKLKAATEGVQKKVTGLQQRIVSITQSVQAKRISEKEGNEQIAALARQIQEEAVKAADQLDQAGALPPSAKKQVEAAKKRLAEAEEKAK